MRAQLHKIPPIIGRSAIAIAKPDYPGFNRVIEPLIPDQQTFWKSLMENGRVRSPIDVVPINPRGVEGYDRSTLCNVAALHQLPTPPESGLGCSRRLLHIRNALAVSDRLADEARRFLSDRTHLSYPPKDCPRAWHMEIFWLAVRYDYCAVTSVSLNR
jgi:hypothetical protein